MFDHREIEKKWQEQWEKDALYTTNNHYDDRDNRYVLVEFPYPSGNLHVGHWYAFAVTDIYARFLQMQGYNVLFPIGFDAFGLPAENAAIKRGLNPREWTFDNIAYMRTQLKSMGASFDWSREVITADPIYYKWTQWFFSQLYEKGLVYQKETHVNWCPSCKTVLANEQVVAGHCERCDTEVEQREMLQWNLNITEYADRLLDDLDALDWPEPIKESQRQWIGKSEGAEIKFEIRNSKSENEEVVKVFTTRPDTLCGATYLVLAPEHPLLAGEIQNKEEVESYVKQAHKKTERERQENKEKTGVVLEGITALNPATGEAIPVWVADYVLGSYGTGAIMAVPAHDERDNEFAQKFDLPVVSVIESQDGEVYVGEGTLINSGKYDGLSSEEARKKMTTDFGEEKTTYRLRDWLVSRQRYWGCPIPIIHCEKCGAVPVPESDLPVVLPEIDDYLPTGDGKSPLAKAEEWVNVACPKCGADAKRETDTLDVFIDSSWYFLRYIDPKNTEVFASEEAQKAWMPVDFYSGGAEHTTVHLLYSRFFHKALFDMGLVTDAEPYKERLNRGLILGPDGNKMSKSKGNVIDPDAVVEKLGADTVRMYLSFIGPYNEVGSYPWNPDSIVGVRRFLERVYMIGEKGEWSDSGIPDYIMHTTIKTVTNALETKKINTGVSALMVFSNAVKEHGVTKEQWLCFVQLLAPYAPHMAEELWGLCEQDGSVHTTVWPTYDPAALVAETIDIAVQINGKVRHVFSIASGATEEDVIQEALEEEKVQKWIGDNEVVKRIYIPGKLLNIVVRT